MSDVRRESGKPHRPRARARTAYPSFKADDIVTLQSPKTSCRHRPEAALDRLHGELFGLDRGVYTAALLLPGVTDYSRQAGAVRLLRTTRQDDGLTPGNLGSGPRFERW